MTTSHLEKRPMGAGWLVTWGVILVGLAFLPVSAHPRLWVWDLGSSTTELMREEGVKLDATFWAFAWAPTLLHALGLVALLALKPGMRRPAGAIVALGVFVAFGSVWLGIRQWLALVMDGDVGRVADVGPSVLRAVASFLAFLLAMPWIHAAGVLLRREAPTATARILALLGVAGLAWFLLGGGDMERGETLLSAIPHAFENVETMLMGVWIILVLVFAVLGLALAFVRESRSLRAALVVVFGRTLIFVGLAAVLVAISATRGGAGAGHALRWFVFLVAVLGLYAHGLVQAFRARREGPAPTRTPLQAFD